MFSNWKTSLFGILAAIAPALKSIIPGPLSAIADGVQVIAGALFAYFAADKR